MYVCPDLQERRQEGMWKLLGRCGVLASSDESIVDGEKN